MISPQNPPLHQTNLLCPICHSVLLGEISYDFWGNQFCFRHHKEFNHCFSCSRLVTAALTQGGLTYPDGRVICGICRKSEIVRPEQARLIADEVKAHLENSGIRFGNFSVPLRFVDQAELVRMSNSHSTQKPTGLTRIQSMMGGGEQRVIDILILFGLPEEHTASVLAHELGHAWMSLNHFPELNEMVCEGIAELIDYFWLKSLNSMESRFRIDLKKQNSDPIYGAGFQHAYNSMQLYGFEKMVQYVRQYRRFPV